MGERKRKGAEETGTPGEPGQSHDERTSQDNNVDQDSAWKDLLRTYFFEFLQFFFPAVAAEVDPVKAPEFLDAELKRFSRRNAAPHRLADLLVKVHRKTGGEELIYCHVEVQSHRDESFERRLLQYAYRVLDRLGRLPVTLAVLTDSAPGFQLTGHYRLETIPGNSLTLEYRVVKLLDLQERVASVLEAYEHGLEEFERGRAKQLNIFAVVVDVHSRMQRERAHGDWRNDRFRFNLKRRLTDEVVNRYGRDARIAADVLRFLDWLIVFPQELDALYLEEVRMMQEDTIVAYVTSWERIGEARGEARGEAKGILKEKRQILERLINRKFGAEPEDHDLIARCDDPDGLDAAVDAVMDAATKEEVLQHIR